MTQRTEFATGLHASDADMIFIIWVTLELNERRLPEAALNVPLRGQAWPHLSLLPQGNKHRPENNDENLKACSLRRHTVGEKSVYELWI